MGASRSRMSVHMRLLSILASVVVTIFGLGALPALARPALSPDQVLRAHDELRSPHGHYRLVMQADCNLVLYEGDRAYWSTRTVGAGRACRLVFQSDGNLVVYDGAGRPRWDSTTWGRGGRSLVLQDDGNLVIYQGRRAIWSTNTVRIRVDAGADVGHPPMPRYSSALEGCAQRGGQVTNRPFANRPWCRIELPDGGRACTDTSQCVGACVWSGAGPHRPPTGRVTGACQRVNRLYGCFGRVVNGHVERYLCID